MAGVFDPALLAEMDLAPFEADSYRQALTEVPRIPGESATEERMRELCYLHLTRFLQVPGHCLTATPSVTSSPRPRRRQPQC